MKLTMWRVVVVLNMYTKFWEKQSPSPFLQGDYFSRNLFTKQRQQQLATWEVSPSELGLPVL